MRTPSMEDYLEVIYRLSEEKGYVRVADIAERLSVLPSSATKMIQKLSKDKYVIYEKYRGFSLTSAGKTLGKSLLERHKLLEEFLFLIGSKAENIYREVEGIEHHLSWHTIMQIQNLVNYLKVNQIKLEDENNNKT